MRHCSLLLDAPSVNLRSLRNLLLLHEIAFLVLVVITGALGGMWAYFWQRSSAEAVQINAMLYDAQQLRGDLYRQIKEVTRAQMIDDPTTLDRYWRTLYRFDLAFNELQRRTRGEAEAAALRSMRESYELMQTVMNKIFADPYAMNEAARIEILDPAYDELILGDFEAHFRTLSELIAARRLALEDNLNRWTALAPVLIPVPILLAVALLLFSYRSLRHGFVQPMRDITAGALQISQGELDVQIPERGVEEVATLAHSINTMARDLAASRDALVESERQAALGALVPVVAHNIRNPLASIRAAAQVTDWSDEDDVREAQQAILDTVDRLERWVSSLLSYLHPLRPHRRRAGIASTVDAAVTLLKPKLDEKNLRLERQGWAQDREMNIDVELVEQALFGLLNNAVEASPEGAKITVSLERVDRGMRVFIDDQGPGMRTSTPPTDLSPGVSTKRFGTGLGIPFAFKVLQAHGGSIDFERSPDGGARVSLLLSSNDS